MPNLTKAICKSILSIMLITTTLSSTFLATPLPAIAQLLPKPPDTGTPSGNPTPGTTRPEAACPKTPKPLTAIVANNGKDFTLSAYPTLWFYIPYRSEQLSRIEFLLLSGNERETIYQTTIQLTDKPGVIKIVIPKESQYALKPDQNYRWRLNLDCRPDRTVEPDLAIDGWIRRIPLNAQLEAQLKAPNNVDQAYRDNQIWYDAINHLAERHFTNPTNAEVNQTWHQLLQTLNLPWIYREPLIEAKSTSPQ
jgi:Domain of Unknown Function (DUF928)